MGTELEDFLADVLPALNGADRAMHDGDPRPRFALWSHRDPVTVFGASATRAGWADVSATFETLGQHLSQCEDYEYEVVAAGVSGDLGYLVAIERTVASLGGAPPAEFVLRITNVLRREEGVWTVVHRHGDAIPEPDTAAVLRRLREGRRGG